MNLRKRLAIYPLAFADILILAFVNFPVLRLKIIDPIAHRLGESSDGTWIIVTGIALFYVSALFLLSLISKKVRTFLAPHGFGLIDKAALLFIASYTIYVGYLLFMLYSGGAI